MIVALDNAALCGATIVDYNHAFFNHAYGPTRPVNVLENLHMSVTCNMMMMHIRLHWTQEHEKLHFYTREVYSCSMSQEAQLVEARNILKNHLHWAFDGRLAAIKQAFPLFKLNRELQEASRQLQTASRKAEETTNALEEARSASMASTTRISRSHDASKGLPATPQTAKKRKVTSEESSTGDTVDKVSIVASDEDHGRRSARGSIRAGGNKTTGGRKKADRREAVGRGMYVGRSKSADGGNGAGGGMTTRSSNTTQ